MEESSVLRTADGQQDAATLSVDLQEPAYKKPRLALWSEIKNA